ncbi:rho guanine nucleotide exchange factor 7 isoform X2 [Nilaparvata lugens]|uniref:rho guanine nucleotide exchange factor 7 isoform X2 n=1 Tax=Nilaparvata lugens TaxID=108931 RepID=UPI00193C9ACD|nr:rho guanine nucleotide exchange factor 7 isoform X2 [Nilaparvata lugens]
MASEDQPHLVQALYSFKGRNNDELCFKKGDIITVTQTEEGGWWEGTFGEKTAWFPSNYVKEYKPNSDSLSLSKSQSTDWAAKQKAYRSFVLKDLIESEKAHVNELQGLYHNFLLPIEKAEIMKKSEYQQLVGNLTEVLEVHSSLLDSLREAATQPPSEQRVGRVFLTAAPQLKHILITYCASHPRAVCVLERYKQELSSLMETHGAVSPGLLVLTAGLSKPFRRLDKYAGMLQEMERHVDESHPDRGDTQRSVAVYKDIASSCSVVRRQKEMEVEVLSGGVRGWEGAEELSALGDILHMGSVAVAPDHQDRYLVLFPSTLLVLSVSHRMSAFIYEGKLPLTGINVNKLEETENCKNSFEIVGPMIERIVAVCQTKEDQQTWIDLLRQQIRAVRGGGLATSPTLRQPLVPTSPSANSIVNSNGGRPWSVSCLRPSPPLRPTRDEKSKRLSKKPGDRGFEEDAQILRVIEGYCMSAKSRYTINSVDLSRLAVTSSASSNSPHSHSSPSTPLHRIASADDDVISGNQLFASTVAACDRCRKSRRASTWCCGHFVLRTLTKAHFQ